MMKKRAKGGVRMALMTKREFAAKYASAKSRRNVAAASAAAYIYAAVSLGFAASAGGYLSMPAAAIPALLALGVQFAKSRFCAVLLLLYGCAGAAAVPAGGWGGSGWLLAAVGVFAVRGTFRLHKEYQDFIRGGRQSGVGDGFGALPPRLEKRFAPREAAPCRTKRADSGGKEAKEAGRRLFFTLLPFAGMFLGLCIIWLSISPGFLKIFVGRAQSPEALLLVYRDWYIVIMAAVAAAVSLSAACSAAAYRGLTTVKSIQIMILALAFPIFLGGCMVIGEGVPSLLVRANEDLSQIESGRLSEVTVWLSPKSRPARLPGPYSSGQPEPVTRYGGISCETGGKWVHFYVPDCLNFSLDPQALYDENKNIAWNKKHARQYLIRYTENFGLAVSLEPAAR